MDMDLNKAASELLKTPAGPNWPVKKTIFRTDQFPGGPECQKHAQRRFGKPEGRYSGRRYGNAEKYAGANS
jgi:hypothetical protein